MKRILLLGAIAMILGTSSQAMAFNFTYPGCGNGGAAWPDAFLPVGWRLNMNGYTGLTAGQAQTITQTSFDEWGVPCCSKFAAAYNGTSTEGFQTGPSNVVIFYHQSWPATLGDPNWTIGITVAEGYGDCSIRGSDIAFNAANFTFVTSNPGNGRPDYQSIATHEIGHFIGITHVNESANCAIPGATMCAAYSGGIAERDLSQDDTNAVCTIYPTSCSCNNSNECSNGQVCTNNQCVDPPCGGNNDCEPGETCSNGSCTRTTCNVNADCGSGLRCSGGLCYPESTCDVCQTCTQNLECNNGGGICAQFQGMANAICTIGCGNGVACPGDSVCVEFTDGQGGTYPLCVNPDAQTNGICPASYTCDDSGSEGCPSTGVSCANEGAMCGSDTEFCVLLQGGDPDGTCSCSCQTASDCGANADCVPLDNGGSACIPGAGPGLCDGVTCPAGESCNPATGMCQANAGACPSLGVSCENMGALCGADAQLCVATSANDMVGACSCDCTTNEDCGTGTCEALAMGGSACFPGPCTGVTCNSGEVCDNTSGNCVPAPMEDMGTDVADGPDMGGDLSSPDATADGGDGGTADMVNDDKGSDDCGCTTVRAQEHNTPWVPLAGLFALFGFVAVRRRRG